MKLTWCHNRLAIGSSANLETAFDLWCQTGADGVTHIINCRRDPDYNRQLEIVKGLVVLWNPVEDDGRPKPVEWFGRSIDFALSALASPRHKVCVCCFHGNNRSPSVVLAILLAQGLEYDDAVFMVQEARPGIELRYEKDAVEAVNMLGYC